MVGIGIGLDVGLGIGIELGNGPSMTIIHYNECLVR